MPLPRDLQEFFFLEALSFAALLASSCCLNGVDVSTAADSATRFWHVVSHNCGMGEKCPTNSTADLSQPRADRGVEGSTLGESEGSMADGSTTS
jgi:hypothetical protein